MLDRIADHSRIVNPTPSDAYVQQRRAAVVKRLGDDDMSVEALEALVEFAAFGIPSSRNDSHTAAANAPRPNRNRKRSQRGSGRGGGMIMEDFSV